MPESNPFYIRKLRIDGLFNNSTPRIIDMESGINCLFGANGSGKTTIINLLVAVLSGDIKKIENTKFKKISIFVAKVGQRKPLRFFTVEKFETKPEQKVSVHYYFHEGFGYESFEVTEITKAIANNLKPFIDKTIAINYLPLGRFNESEIDNIREKEYFMRNFRGTGDGAEDLEILSDTVRRMLISLERKFKDEFSKKQKTIRTDLENLKDKVLEKLLIDDGLVQTVSETALRKITVAKSDFVSTKEKLDYIGLKIPNDKLEKHFSLMAEVSESLNERQELYMASIKDAAATPSDSQKAMKQYGDVLRTYRSLTPFHNRLLHIIKDVERSAAYRLSQQKLFTDFESSINSFFVNKEFEFTDVGGFSFTCRDVPTKIEELSSGEKHIVALLGKVALAKSAGSVFIADEPELSLHLSWQRKLLPAIQQLAPGMQIIVATHAPAIIPSSANTIDLDEVDDVKTAI